jgi:hypothetical protein
VNSFFPGCIRFQSISFSLSSVKSIATYCSVQDGVVTLVS